jgi:hypothetical protein
VVDVHRLWALRKRAPPPQRTTDLELERTRGIALIIQGEMQKVKDIQKALGITFREMMM